MTVHRGDARRRTHKAGAFGAGGSTEPHRKPDLAARACAAAMADLWNAASRAAAMPSIVRTCLQGNTDCAVALVKAGCDTSIRNTLTGLTGRDMAEQKGHTLPIKRCRVAKRQRKALMAGERQHCTGAEEASSTFASEAEEKERLQKAAKKREANRKKKERQK